MLSAKKTDHFKQLLESPIADLERGLRTTEREVRAEGLGWRPIDPTKVLSPYCGWNATPRQRDQKKPNPGCAIISAYRFPTLYGGNRASIDVMKAPTPGAHRAAAGQGMMAATR